MSNISSAAAAAPRLSHRYYAMKAKWLGMERMNHWDRNAPLPSGAEANAVIVLAEHGISPQIRFIPPGPQPAQR